jgi:hypothetical protein
MLGCCEHGIEPYDVGFNPSTQRHYRRLIYYIYIATCFGRTTIIRMQTPQIKMVLNLWVPPNAGKFLSGCTTGYFSRRGHLLVVC